MTSVKGIYENGQIKLLEDVQGKSGQRVIITFLEEEASWDESDIRRMSLTHPNRFIDDYLNDEREDLYQDFANRSSK